MGRDWRLIEGETGCQAISPGLCDTWVRQVWGSVERSYSKQPLGQLSVP